MYYADLTIYPAPLKDGEPFAKAIGWLDKNHIFPMDSAPASFLDRLEQFCCGSRIASMGMHSCEFCKSDNLEPSIQCGKRKLSLGGGTLIIFGSSQTYVAPDLILHYVRHHKYCPPNEFIQAIQQAPLPNSPEFQQLMSQCQWGTPF